MKFFRILFLLASISLYSQDYTAIPQPNDAVQKNELGLSQIDIKLASFRNSQVDGKKKEDAVMKALAQLAIVKTNYDNAKQYPKTITDGWHLVMATDNYNFCSPAKVFIEDNTITKFVAGNWMKLARPFKVLSPIHEGKALISLDFNSNTDTVELFFIHDLTQATTVEKPLASAYICFWSDLNKASTIKIWVDEYYFGKLSQKHNSQPNCAESGTITIEVEPGSYYFKGAGRGTIDWNGQVVAKENECLSYRLNKKNKS